MQANDAMRILGSAAAMGLLGGGSALAYNAVSQPTLDEYGNTIESNDINPFVAALGGAAIGAASGGVYGKYNQPVARPVQSMNRGASPQPRQSPDIDIPDKELFKPPAGYEGSTVMVAKDGKRYVRRPGQGAMWELIDEPTQQTQTPQVQIVPANPMELQNPMSPPGMKTVVMQQPPKAPGQEMMEEALRLRELANQQGNPLVPYDVFGESDGYWEAQKKRA